MSERRAFGGSSQAGIASAGVVLGHWLAYRFAIPQTALRASVLETSGHGYWLGAVKLAVVLLVASVGFVLIGDLAGRIHGRTGAEGPDPLSRVATRLAVVQVAAFTAMEIVERLAAGVSPAGVFHHHVFVVGVLVQVMVAGVGALVLHWLGRAASRVALPRTPAPLRRAPGTGPSVLFGVFVPALEPQAGAAGVRGPPRA